LAADGVGLDPAREVDAASDRGVLAAPGGADVSDDDLGVVQPDAHLELGQTRGAVARVDARHRVLHLDRAGDCLLRAIGHVLRRSEKGERASPVISTIVPR
jgi:hypothetical protein